MSEVLERPYSEAAAPVTAGRAEALYETGVVSYQAHQARTWKLTARRCRIAAGGMLVLNLVLGAGIITMLPLKQYVPIFAYINEAGLLDTTTAVSDLPPNLQVAGIESLLWQYLRHRESYAPSEAAESYEIVSAMSSLPVRQQYQDWANAKNNKAAPAAVLKDRGFIRTNRIYGAFLSHTDDYSSGVYQIRFCRTVSQENSPTTQQRMSATIHYTIAHAVPAWERVSFNHEGLIVTEYPGPQEEGAPGVPHPCVG